MNSDRAIEDFEQHRDYQTRQMTRLSRGSNYSTIGPKEQLKGRRFGVEVSSTYTLYGFPQHPA
ncbi:MAG: hypothetical protein MUO27_10605 [Sedimentisphaerales bacterium]|nr:hypothetical protein [Sedimentisphaerales bacterium]